MNQPSSEIREEIKDLIVASSNKGADNVSRLISLGMDYHLAEADPERTNIFGLLDRLEAAIRAEVLAEVKETMKKVRVERVGGAFNGDTPVTLKHEQDIAEKIVSALINLLDAEVINTER